MRMDGYLNEEIARKMNCSLRVPPSAGFKLIRKTWKCEEST